MATTFWIEVKWRGATCLYQCQLLGMHYQVTGKNKSILISHEGKLLAGEINADFVKPLFEAIQEQMRPPDTAMIVSIQTPKS